MARILVFEDHYLTQDEIQLVLRDTPHEIVGQAETLARAQEFIGQILSHEIEVDVLLLDGTLAGHDRPTEFRYTFPPDTTQPVKKNLFGRVKHPKPREVVVPNTENSLGRDARMVKKILAACEIEIPTIGISTDSMEDIGIDVDIDLTKFNLRNGLVPAIEQLTNK